MITILSPKQVSKMISLRRVAQVFHLHATSVLARVNTNHHFLKNDLQHRFYFLPYLLWANLLTKFWILILTIYTINLHSDTQPLQLQPWLVANVFSPPLSFRPAEEAFGQLLEKNEIILRRVTPVTILISPHLLSLEDLHTDFTQETCGHQMRPCWVNLGWIFCCLSS